PRGAGRRPVRRLVATRSDPCALRPARAHPRRGRGTRMSTELVRVTIDERDVHVPKGTGIVETALAAGVEIPVFCYEPRLGAPVGACRMCLVEVEGMPELQTGCTRTARAVAPSFADRPYTRAFTGAVTELCPVGALLPAQYRFEGRPWEIVAVPTVCGLCPVGCNVHATVREGKVKRILSRNHPEIDEGWICDKGRFAYTHLHAEDRLAQPLQRVRRSGLAPVSWDKAIGEEERLLRDATGGVG